MRSRDTQVDFFPVWRWTEASDYHACDLAAHDGGQGDALESERRTVVCPRGCLAPNRAPLSNLVESS